jgi:tetratricopeptide (TPR) repeat protein
MSSAEELKAKGNKALQSGNVKEAIDCYTEAIQKDGSNKVYFSNRSAAYMKSEDFRSALSDGEKAIELAPTWARVIQEKVQLFTHSPVSKKQKLLMKKLPNSSLEIKLSKMKSPVVPLN